MVPWIMERGEVPLAEVAEQFQLTEAEVIADLERVAMCGVPPYEPGDLVDLFVDEGVVYAGIPRFFTRPLRLTTPEAFALLTSGRAAMQLPGAETDGALGRALAKLESALGGAGLEIELSRPALTSDVVQAIDDRAELVVAYWSARREATTDRKIHPLAVFTDRGRWYVRADDLDSGEERTFRIDRIERIERSGETFEWRPVSTPVSTGWFADDDLPTVTLLVERAAAWITERYPTRSITERDDGRLEVVMPVTSEPWLTRLLLRAGSSVSVAGPDRFASLAADAASSLLRRYAD